MSKELNSQYDPKATEQRIYNTWLNSGFFNPDNLPERGKGVFVISAPPPNVTGSLHLGHALNAVIQDIIIRKKRMEGYATLWIPGTDHAGIATQNVVEKELKKQNISRHDLGREKFLEKVWEWKEKYGNIILDQFKKLGASMDWSRARFTMDEKYQRAVAEAFVHYYQKGWLYRAERVINWCTRCQTSLSDLEIEYKEEKTKLYYIKYPLSTSYKLKAVSCVTVATTRPETMLGDAAVAVNPKDSRYQNLIGKKLILPVQNREIPIITDDEIDQNFGTGAVKVTPAHDILDAKIGEKNKLPVYKVIGQFGKMTDEAGVCSGMKTAECREKIIELLKKENLIEKIEDYTHNVALCYRCGGVIEPLPSLQWFLKMDELAKRAVKAAEDSAVVFHPENWKKVYLAWLKNIRDWNVSRQIWWGHRLPVYYCKSKPEGITNDRLLISKAKQNENCPPLADPPQAEKLEIRNSSTEAYAVSVERPERCPFCNMCKMEQSVEVLDTWFSSALWPLAILNWPEKTEDFAKYYPNNVLSTARDILNLWVMRMIFSGLEFTGQPPFKDVIIHATILTKDGKRMSKSLGTGIDPINLIEKYGADATRFGVIWQNMGTQDIRWSEEHVLAGKKFCNKIWNIARFTMLQTGNLSSAPAGIASMALDDTARDFYEKLRLLITAVNKQIDNYEFGAALHALYEFIWHEFADKYIEYAKIKNSPENLILLNYALLTSLKLLHPFMPFITEEIWSKIAIDGKSLLIIEKWPR